MVDGDDDGGGVDDGDGVVGSSVDKGGSVVGSLGLGVVLGVLSLALITDISDIAGVFVNGVAHNLGAAVGKGNTVLASGGITITVLLLVESSTGVVVGDGIAILVDSGSVIFGLLVAMNGLGSVVRSGSRGMVSGSMMHGLSMDDGGGMHNRGSVDNRDSVVGSGMDHRDSVVGSSVVDGGMVDGSVGGGLDVVGRLSIGGIVLLLVVVLVDLVGLSRGLRRDVSDGDTVRLVDGGADSRGIAELDSLVGRLVGSGDSEESGSDSEGLHFKG
jgi:hypothetical protein